MSHFSNEFLRHRHQSLQNDSMQKNNQEANFYDNSLQAIQMRQFQFAIDHSDEMKQLMFLSRSAQENDIKMQDVSTKQTDTDTSTDDSAPNPFQMLAMERLGTEEIQALLPHTANWNEIIQLTELNRSLTDILALFSVLPKPTTQQIIQTDQFSVEELQQLMTHTTHWDEIIQLAVLNRSTTDIIALFSVLPKPTVQQIVQMDRFSVEELQQLIAHTANWDEIVQLAALNRPVADIVVLFSVLPSPTLQQIVQIDRFSLEELEPLLNYTANWDEMLQLAALNRSAKDIVALFSVLPKPTVQQIIQMDRFSLEELQQLIAHTANWDEIVQLAALNRPVADIVVLFSVLPSPTLQQIVQIDRFSLEELEPLLSHTANWDEMLQLAALNRSAKDIVTLFSLTPRPTLQQIVALDRYTNADIQIIKDWPEIANWDDVVSLTHLTREQIQVVNTLSPAKHQLTTIYMAKHGPGIERNTALQIINGHIAVHDRSDTPLPNSEMLCYQNNFDPQQWTYYQNPVDGSDLAWLNGMTGKSHNANNVIIVFKDMVSIEDCVSMLVHEMNHSLNNQPFNSLPGVADFKEEFRAYWVAQFRNVADLTVRTNQIFQHIMNGYPYISGPYNSNPASKLAIDQFCEAATKGENVFEGRNVDNA